MIGVGVITFIGNIFDITEFLTVNLGENFWNVGKTKEIKARVLHI